DWTDSLGSIEGSGRTAKPSLRHLWPRAGAPEERRTGIHYRPLLRSCAEQPGCQPGEKNASNSAPRSELTHIRPCCARIPDGKMPPCTTIAYGPEQVHRKIP